jgi:hypothetical protein
MAAEREGELRKREEMLEQREREVRERRSAIGERKLAIEQRRRKTESEIDDVIRQQQDQKRDFEKLKAEMVRSIEQEEGEAHVQALRESRNRAIEAEVDTRRLKADRERVQHGVLQDEREFAGKFDELSRMKRQLV